MGVIYFKSFEYDKALDYFNKAKSTQVQNPLILEKMKDYFIIEGDLDKALTSQKKITELLPKNIGQWQELIKLYNWNNMTYQALKAQFKVVSLRPKKDKYQKLLNISKGYQWLRKWDDATAIAKMIYQSDEPKILEENLKYFLTIGDTNFVIKHIHKLEKLTKDTAQYKYYLSQVYRLKKDYKNAIINLLIMFGNDQAYAQYYDNAKFLNKPIQYIAHHIDLVNEISELYRKLGHDIVVARISAKLYEMDSQKYDQALDACDIFVKHKFYQETTKILKKIYTVHSASRVFRAANIYLDLGKRDLAIKYMEKAIELYPYKPQYYNDLTYLYELKGQKRKALNLQLKLLKLLEEKNKSSRYFINASEVMIAQNGSFKITSNNAHKIKQTRNKIIQLMDELGENNKKHQQLLELNNEYPNDIKTNKMLAYSYLDRGDYNKARQLFIKINKISPTDKDAAIFVTDDLLDKNKKEKAYSIMKPFIKSHDVLVKNRLYNIYQKINPKEANLICDEHQVQSISDFEQIDLKVKCNEANSLYKDNINLLLAHLDQKPGDVQAKIVLAYQLILDHDIKNAKKIINDLTKENVKKKVIISLNKFKEEVILDLKIQKSWEHSFNLSNYDTKNYSYWASTFQLYRNTGKLSYGVTLLRAQPNTKSKNIGSNSLLFKYHIKDDLVVSLHFGNNFGHSNKVAYGHSITYQWYDQLELSYIGNIATQIYDIPAFSTATESLRDSQALYLNYDYNFRNRFNFSFEYNHYYLDKYFAKSRLTSIQYNHFLTTHWSPGLFLQKQETYEGDNYLKSLLIESSNIQAINIKYEYIFYTNKFKNTFDLYLGQDIDRKIKFGKYASLRENLYYDHSKRKRANLSLVWNKASQNINVNESFIIEIGYSFWFI